MNGAIPQEEWGEMISEVRSLHARAVEHNHDDRERFDKIDSKLTDQSQRLSRIEKREAFTQGALKVIIGLIVIVGVAVVPAAIWVVRATTIDVLLDKGIIGHRQEK